MSECKVNHFDIPGGEKCPRCGKVVKRDVYGREIDPSEVNDPQIEWRRRWATRRAERLAR